MYSNIDHKSFFANALYVLLVTPSRLKLKLFTPAREVNIYSCFFIVNIENRRLFVPWVALAALTMKLAMEVLATLGIRQNRTSGSLKWKRDLDQ